MADYYPLISRAVIGLDKNTGENRRVLYERARSALVTQLRSVEPALDEADITRERLALEEAIRKVEGEAAKSAKQAKPEPPPARATREPPQPPPSSLRDRGLRDFHDQIAEADELGEAASSANRSARKTYAAMPSERPAPPAFDHGKPAAREDTHYFEPPASDEAQAQAPFSEADEHEEHGEAPYGDYDAPEAALPPPPHYEGPGESDYRPARSWGRAIKLVVLVLVLAGLAGAAFWQRGAISNLVASLHSSPPAVKQAAAPPAAAPKPAPAGTPKIADRVAPSTAPGTTQPATAPAAAVAQKVVLYEEEANNPQGKRYVGSAVWRTVTVSPGPGLAPELAVRADVDVPERHLHMTWSLRRNTDKALPASHTIEIMFTLPADFDQGSIGNVPGVLMKSSEKARGQPLAGLSVKVTNGYFLIGLSAADADKQRNIALLKDRDWFDIPIVYTSGKRAILAMEKGPPGQRAFAEAFRAWGE